MRNSLLVYPIGCEVYVNNMEARILGIMISNSDMVEYKVCYWEDNRRVEIWIRDFEIKKNKSKVDDVNIILAKK